MHVDKTGSERKAASVDGFVRLAFGTIADMRDPAVRECDVRGERRPAVAVVDTNV
jgi:hypothetical protein